MIAWKYLNKKIAATEALKDYTVMKFIVENNSCALEETRNRMTAIPSSSISAAPNIKNPNIAETRLAASLDEIDVLKERYRRLLEYMEWFEPAWTALSEDEQFVLTEFYSEDDNRQIDTIGNICERYHIERSSAYNKKNRALERLAMFLYGK